MEAIITNKSATTTSTYFSVLVGTSEIFIGHCNDGRVNVCVNNASHRAFRRLGRFFPSLDAALASYKSGAVRTALFITSTELGK